MRILTIMSFFVPRVLNIDKELNSIQEGKCPKCSGILINKKGKHGKFLACSEFPKCRYGINRRGIKKMKEASQKGKEIMWKGSR